MYGRIGASFDVLYSGEADEANQSAATGQTDVGSQRFANMFARMHLAGVVLPTIHLRVGGRRTAPVNGSAQSNLHSVSEKLRIASAA